MLRVTTVTQLSIMRADSTKKRPIMHIQQEDTRFTLGIIPTKLPWLIWKSMARSSRFKEFGLEAASGGLFHFKPSVQSVGFTNNQSRTACLELSARGDSLLHYEEVRRHLSQLQSWLPAH
jgi:hypothetical protein